MSQDEQHDGDQYSIGVWLAACFVFPILLAVLPFVMDGCAFVFRALSGNW